MVRLDWMGTLVPWFSLAGAGLVFVLVGLYKAIHSEAGGPLTTGESPAFAWLRAWIDPLLGAALSYLMGVAALQYVAVRRLGPALTAAGQLLVIVAGLEAAATGTLLFGLWLDWSTAVSWSLFALETALLVQATITLTATDGIRRPGLLGPLDLPGGGTNRVIGLVFLLGALTGYLDPSRQAMAAYVHLDSQVGRILMQLMPALLAGMTTLWFGLATSAVLGAGAAAWRRLDRPTAWRPLVGVLPFAALAAACASIFVASIFYALEWELERLDLKGVIPSLLVLLAGGGGMISYAAFRAVERRTPRAAERNRLGMVALASAAVLVAPVVRLVPPAPDRRNWRCLLVVTLTADLAIGVVVLLGALFNPWFTVFSYLKGAILKAVAVVAAGLLVLLWDDTWPAPLERRPPSAVRLVAPAILLLGFGAFAGLECARAAKAAVLNFGELSMVDATYARAVTESLGLSRWIRLGQAPRPDPAVDPWPLPWRLVKTRPSRLPADFNLVVVVVDALRGDAARSAGYHRDLMSFLDRWASREAIGFRRAYSQGGGTYAAFPFLVGGRSWFGYYGAHAYRANLYFEVARAEGIRRFMIVRDWPRAIFPPAVPVVALGDGQSSAGRSDAAGQVFDWAEAAIARFQPGERFFAFLVLLDVHNDLWKKSGGLDFGDAPRDLYDNNVSYVDGAMARFVEWLRHAGLYERTVVVFTSDHGEQFWEHGASLHGHTLYEEDLRVPLVLRVPGLPGGWVDVPVVVADVPPTLAELAGYSVDPPYADSRMGISLVPLLRDGAQERYRRRDVVGMASFKRRYFLYRDWRWKLVYSADFDLLELFDLADDPAERRNRLAERPDVAAALERELFGYLFRVTGRSYRPLLSAR
ncbi:MAG TPA: sulfatase-like hydrolase/transferase [Methylomirabilota bacterium]|jgi:hypothetical protein|nr:sulfatase-like hydrolase/transferase [Methylomirabilota bacterium]